MSDEINEDTRRQLFHHLLLLCPGKATLLIGDVYDHLKDKYFVIKPSFGYSPEFYVSPGQPVPDHRDKIKNALLIDGLKYASQRVRNDKDLVLAIIAKQPRDLKYASPDFQNNNEIVMVGIKQCPMALKYASERIRSDRKFIQFAIINDIKDVPLKWY